MSDDQYSRQGPPGGGYGYGAPPPSAPQAPYGQGPVSYPNGAMAPYQGAPMQQAPAQAYPMAPGYAPGAPMAAPINIVVQNTNMVGTGAGGLVRSGNRSRVVAALLAFLLGGIGVHKFYLGQHGMGVLYLLGCWTMIPTFVGFFEGVSYLLTSEHAFDMKYNARLA